MNKQKLNEAVVLTLPSDASLSCAADYLEIFKQHLQNRQKVTLDASVVENIDAGFLQLLAAFFKTARNGGIDVAWQSASENLRESARLSGLTDHLQV